jgi:hypothetical protein
MCGSGGEWGTGHVMEDDGRTRIGRGNRCGGGSGRGARVADTSGVGGRQRSGQIKGWVAGCGWRREEAVGSREENRE